MSSTKPSKPLFALVDCNNFYVSCERVFNPRLWNKPVVILSNNDGCVIARSNEAKALGIPMGAPAFKYRDLFERQRVITLSSNYELYGEMSHRVMHTLAQFTPDIEIYSIDEAFLHIDSANLAAESRRIKETVYQWTGIPVSVGIAPTKTLAKAANRHAKKKLPQEGVFILNDADLQKKILSYMPVEEVWGIGQQIAAKLKRNQLYTGWDLANANDGWVKKHLTVVGLRTVWELRGTSCLSLEEAPAPKKSIVCSRSFGCEVTEEEELAEALASYTARAAEKVRHQGSAAAFIEVFLCTNRFKEELVYANAAQLILPQPTDFTPHLIHFAKQALHKIFRDGLSYKKVGVMLGGLVPKNSFQQDLFHKNTPSLLKQQRLMQLMDQTNRRYGKGTMKLAAEGVAQPWKMQRNQCSPHFTTRWEDLLSIRI
jgi:DNA polymerase V